MLIMLRVSEDKELFNENRSCIEIIINGKEKGTEWSLMKTEVVLKWTSQEQVSLTAIV